MRVAPVPVFRGLSRWVPAQRSWARGVPAPASPSPRFARPRRVAGALGERLRPWRARVFVGWRFPKSLAAWSGEHIRGAGASLQRGGCMFPHDRRARCYPPNMGMQPKGRGFVAGAFWFGGSRGISRLPLLPPSRLSRSCRAGAEPRPFGLPLGSRCAPDPNGSPKGRRSSAKHPDKTAKPKHFATRPQPFHASEKPPRFLMCSFIRSCCKAFGRAPACCVARLLRFPILPLALWLPAPALRGSQ